MGVHEKRLGRLIELAIGSEGKLPVEFRIFRAGVNDTTQGPIVFDADAAEAVMAAYAQHGVDLVIDLAHDSIDEQARVHRNDADDARGWCRLELRDGPELWAVGVTWTPDGARRLTERTQRYISPVVFIDTETNRALEVFNLALCSMPATHNAAPLVAARRTAAPAAWEIKSMTAHQVLAAVKAARAGDEEALVALEMTPEQARKAIAAVKEQSGEAALALVESLLADALGAGGEEGGDAAPAEPLEDAPADPKQDPEQDKQMAAALRRVAKLAGLPEASPLSDVEAEVKRLRNEVDAMLAERARADVEERGKLVGELVRLRADTPATAWEDADKKIVAKRLREEPLDDLRRRVALLRKSVPVAEIEAPESALVELTDDQRKRAERMTPAQRETFVAMLRNRNRGA
jgi:hypothetical protein